jgi:putative transposase
LAFYCRRQTRRRTCTAGPIAEDAIVAKLRQVDVLVSQGQDMAAPIRQIGVSEVTYYRWRQEFGGLKIEQVKRLKDLSDLTLDKLILQEAARGKLLSPARRRACIEQVRAQLHVSERRACAALGQHRWTQRKGAVVTTKSVSRPYHRACPAIRPLRLSQDRRAAAAGRLAHQRQAGRAHLATRGAQGPP